MAYTTDIKCKVITDIHCSKLNYKKTAEASGISSRSVRNIRDVFCESSGLKCLRNPNDNHLYFGETMDILDALNFPHDRMNRIAEIMVEENLFKS